MTTSVFSRLACRSVLAVSLACLALPALAAGGVSLVGLFPGKALLVIGSSNPRAVAVGQEVDGVKVLATTSESATLMVDGKRVTLGLDSYYTPGAVAAANQTARLDSGPGGHYFGHALVNGQSVDFLVDTGATIILMSAGDARRLGIQYKNGRQQLFATANGTSVGYTVSLDHVKVGDIELSGVDASVQENGFNGPMLLGMSFLSHTNMKIEGGSMLLSRRL